MTRRVRYDDSGQSMLPLMVLLAFTLVIITFSLLVPWGAATTEKAQTQTAADAAALAATQAKRDWWVERTGTPGRLDLATGLRTLRGVGRVGCDEAASFARSNGATLLECRAGRGARATVSVEVENGRTSDAATGFARATSTAEQRISFGACRWDVPAPPVATKLDGGPDRFPASLRCGASWSVEYQVDNLPPYRTVAVVGTTRAQLVRGLEPRLSR